VQLGLVHEILSIGEKSVKTPASTGTCRPGWGPKTTGAETLGNRGAKELWTLSNNGFPAALHAGSHYSLLTAADEKIPLPVGHVNKKPQYLVFPAHLRHLHSKQQHLPVESLRNPHTVRIS
jgi:hypothetical protein